MVVEATKFISPKGLVNLGNTCFFNSTLQCMLSLPLLVKFFRDTDFKEDRQPISKAFQNFILNYVLEKDKIINPNLFIQEIRGKIRLFDKRQQDAHSFLESFLSLLIEENEVKSSEKETKNKLLDIFTVEHKDTITCKKCFYMVEKTYKSPIQYLFIDESINKSIINYETIEDIVDSALAWKCEKCLKKVPSGIKHKISSSSDYFVIHLNRFLNLYHKNQANIFVDRELEIADDRYEFVGAVLHSGDLNNGHYFSVASRSGHFYKFNDSLVDPVVPEINSSKPYILFYKKKRNPKVIL
ncbi:Usp36 [Nucleospora cyclopteri]